MKVSDNIIKRTTALAAGLFLTCGAAGAADTGTISAGKLARDAKNYYGQTVTVSAEVEDVVDSRTFTLDEDSILAGADVLVLVPTGVAAKLAKDQKVMVTGTVRRYVSAEFERDYDWFKGGDLVRRGVKLDLDTRPVLIATSVRTADGRDAMTGTAGSASTMHGGHAGHQASTMPAHGAHAGMMAASAVTAGKLARDAKDFYGQTVTVSAEIEDVIDSRTFTLDEDSILAGADVLVLVPSGVTATLAKDQKVTVTGRVRQYVSTELERDYDWFKNGTLVQRGVKLDTDTRPVIVATSVRTADGREAMGGAMPASHSGMHSGAHSGAHAGMGAGHAGHAGMDPAAHAAMAGSISAGKLAREGKKMYGQTVTVSAEVEDVLNNRMFTLDEDSVLTGADVIVLVPAGVTATLAKDQKVMVTGTVRPYVVADLEKDYDWFKDGELVKRTSTVDWKTRPVVVATSVRTASGADLMTSR